MARYQRLLYLVDNMCDEWCHLGLSIFTFFVVIVTATIHLLAWFPSTASEVLYLHISRTEMMNFGVAPFMDPDWICWMWVAVYIYQLLLAVYVMSLMCRSRGVSGLLRDVIKPTYMLVYLLCLGSLLAWTILFDRTETWSYFIVLALFGACVFATVAFSMVITQMTEFRISLIPQCRGDVIAMRVLVVNGLAAMATWIMVLLLYNVCQSLILYAALDLELVRYLWLGIVAGVIVIFFLVDVLATASALEYTLTPFLISLIAFTSTIIQNLTTDVLDDVMEYVIYCLIGLILVLTFVALGISIYRGKHVLPPEMTDSDWMKLTQPCSDINNTDSKRRLEAHYSNQGEKHSYNL